MLPPSAPPTGRLWRPLLAAALVAALAPVPAAHAAAAFGPGEVLVYDVRYGPVHTGQARIAVGSDSMLDDLSVWPIVIQARTNETFSRIFEVRDRIISFWAPLEARTVGFDMYAHQGKERRFTRMRLDHAAGEALVHRQSPGQPSKVQRYDIGRTSHDLTSAIFWLRLRALAAGDVERVSIFTGSKTWELVATVEAREQITTDGGAFDTVRVRVQTQFQGKLAAKRDIVVWMTDDLAHVPVQVEAELALGSVTAKLASWLPGVRH